MGDRVYLVEKLLKKRKRRGAIEYFVKWKNWGDQHSTWEPEDNILDRRLISQFNKLLKNEPQVNKSKRGRKKSVRLKTEISSKLFSEETTNPSESAPKIPKLSPSPPESKPVATETKTIWLNRSHEYWRQRNPVVDQVFIMDVQVDLNMVTIKGCPTDRGFFREREVKTENTEMES